MWKNWVLSYYDVFCLFVPFPFIKLKKLLNILVFIHIFILKRSSKVFILFTIYIIIYDIYISISLFPFKKNAHKNPKNCKVFESHAMRFYSNQKYWFSRVLYKKLVFRYVASICLKKVKLIQNIFLAYVIWVEKKTKGKRNQFIFLHIYFKNTIK